MKDASPQTAATVVDRAEALRRFCFAYDELFIIPVDHLSQTGISDAFASAIIRERGMTQAWVSAFDGAFSTYWERAANLYARAPDAWFPPRLQNVCVVTDRERARPYHQPLFKASWSLDVGDFDPEGSNLEFATYQLLHAERLATSQDMAKSIVSGLSYWLVRSQEEIEQFSAAAHSSPRLDGSIFALLAEAMSWVRTLFHPSLRPPPEDALDGLRPVVEGSLLVPASAQAELRQLVADIRRGVEAVLARDRSARSASPRVSTGTSPAASVCAWLAAHRPAVLVTDEAAVPLWDPDAPDDVDAIRDALGDIAPRVAASLQADIEVVGTKTRAFLSSLKHPEALPLTTSEVDQAGGVYLHDQRRVVVYSLGQPGLDPRKEEAPAYHRLLLAARTIHEWGHLADAAGWLGVPAALEVERDAARTRISRAVDAIIAAAPAGFQRGAASDARAAAKEPAELVYDLLQYRMPDYVSNLLARRYLHPSELEAYVRANVHPHFDEDLSPPQLLARYAFEFQYLGLGLTEEPMRYFLQTTWFSTYLVETRVLTEERLAELFSAVAALCGCYRVDTSAFV